MADRRRLPWRNDNATRRDVRHRWNDQPRPQKNVAVIFFGRRQLRGSLPWMAGFWLSVGATIATFAPISRPAAALLVPTQIWVTIAAKLNLDIVNLNRDKELSPAAASAAAAAGGASAGK